MAKRKETPKKFYPKSIVDLEYMCRLCGSFEDKKYCKNVFIKQNENLLHIAEIINGGSLAFETGLPNLLCRPCMRKKAGQFSQIQESYNRNAGFSGSKKEMHGRVTFCTEKPY
jgi:hypothetical protein